MGENFTLEILNKGHLGILRQLKFRLSSVTLSNCQLHRLSSPISKMSHCILLLYPWLYLFKCDAK